MRITVRELLERDTYQFLMSGVHLTREQVERIADTSVASIVLNDVVVLSACSTGGGRLSFDIPYELHLGGTVFCESAIPGEWEFRWKKTFGVVEEWSSLTGEWQEVDVIQLPLGARCTWRVERILLEGKS